MKVIARAVKSRIWRVEKKCNRMLTRSNTATCKPFSRMNTPEGNSLDQCPILDERHVGLTCRTVANAKERRKKKPSARTRETLSDTEMQSMATAASSSEQSGPMIHCGPGREPAAMGRSGIMPPCHICHRIRESLLLMGVCSLVLQSTAD